MLVKEFILIFIISAEFPNMLLSDTIVLVLFKW